MALFRIQGKIVLFVHIPKTGGTSIGKALMAAGAKTALHAIGVRPYSRCEPPHAHAAVLQKLVSDDFYDLALAVHRNPYSRLVSEYRMRMRVTDPQRQPAFDTWVNETLDAYKADPYHLDNHIRPQTSFLFDKVKAFRYEDGLRHVRAHLAYNGIDIGEIPTDPHSRETPPIQANPGTLHRVRKLYKADFRLLGYDPHNLSPLR